MAEKKIKEPQEAQAEAVKEAATDNTGKSVLVKVGKAAIKKHNLKVVYVTSDGQAFPLESDARNHAANLDDKEIVKVS